jgi:hypothetical protein
MQFAMLCPPEMQCRPQRLAELLPCPGRQTKEQSAFQEYDLFYKNLIGAVALKNVTSRFAMEKNQVSNCLAGSVGGLTARPFMPHRSQLTNSAVPRL